MSDESLELEAALREMTHWRGEEPGLWESALAEHGKSPRRAGIVNRMVFWNLPRALAAGVVLLVSVATALVVTMNARSGRTHSAAVSVASPESITRSQANMKALGAAAATYAARWNDRSMQSVDDDIEIYRHGSDIASAVDRLNTQASPVLDFAGAVGGRPPLPSSSSPSQLPDAAGRQWQVDAGSVLAPADGALRSPSAGSVSDRQVIRKATIELQTADVRSVFLKASLLTSEAEGEYIEQSALTGEGDGAQASLVLRVASTRLDQVMNALRLLAVVRAENMAGEDVTPQIVDLEARLRNEERIEEELLELLEKRADSPLDEILKLRSEIARIRQAIEQISAQQLRFSRLVSLSTILVIIRPEPKPAEQAAQTDAKPATLKSYFGDALSDSWRDGVRFLADTIAGLVGILIGGAVWWIALVIGLLALRQHLRRRAGLA